MKAKHLYKMQPENAELRKEIDKGILSEVDKFTENVFLNCEIRGKLLTDDEVAEVVTAVIYDLLRHTDDYDGQ